MFQPVIVQAQVENISDLIFAVGSVLETLIGVTFAAALLVFLWGLAIFVLNSGNEKKIEDGRRLMFWGIIVLFVSVSVWGIVVFLQDTFGVRDPNAPIERGVDFYPDDNDPYNPFGNGGPVAT